MHKKFILVIVFLKKDYFHFFLILKMAAKYAEHDRVGGLDISFQQVSHVRNF